MLDEFIKAQQKFTALRIEYFYNEVLFSFQWWLLIVLSVVPWVIWWKLVDKKRLKPIISCGLIIVLFAIILDDIGLTMSLWAYPYQTYFVTSRMNAVDMAILPVFYMLIYQYFPRWIHYVTAVALLALFAAFIAEPLFAVLNLYIKLKWEYIYSVPIYFAIGVFTKWFIHKLDEVSEKHQL